MFHVKLKPQKVYVDKAKRTYGDIVEYYYEGTNWDGSTFMIDGWRLDLFRDAKRFQTRIFTTKKSAKEYGDWWVARTDE
jgi:hypothetical protein